MQPYRKKERFLLPGYSGKYFGKDPFLNMENNAKENGAMNIHFIGVGGVSMSTLAAVSAKGGMTVTGSDRAPSAVTERLEESGIRVFCPQSAENLDKAGRIDRVVYTAAIPEDNPELKEARRRGIPCMRRSEYLGQLMKQYSVRIGVSGTHGKSSTTGMLAHLFLEAGKNPTVACGAELCELHSAYRLGGSEHFVYEACEYKDAFLDFFPTVAVMLNMEMDHVDYYHSMEQMERSYISSAKDAKAVVLNGDDPHLRSVAERLKGVWVVKAGVNSIDCDYRAADIQMKGGFASFDFYKENEKLARICLGVPGRHHVYNALCAGAAAHLCGLSPKEIAKGIGTYQGILRRFEYKGQHKGAKIYDDYAHHPTEIAATLRTAKEMLPEGGRLFCVFQPHTYSRTAGLFEDFVKALSLCDRLYLAPIYAAREQNTYGVSSEQLAERIQGAECLQTFEEIAGRLESELSEGDILLTMGAGNAYKAGELLISEDQE